MRTRERRILGIVVAGAMAAATGGGAGGAGAATVAPETWGVQPTGASAFAHSELVWQKKVATDVYRYKYRYGPVVAGAGQNLILFGPVTVERPSGTGWGVRFKPDLEFPNGKIPPIEEVHTHHGLILTTSRMDITYPRIPQRMSAWAEEKTIGFLPRPYGYLVKASDQWMVNYMLHNETSRSHQLYITYEVDWIPADTRLGKKMKPVQPIWLDVKNGSAYPVFDVKRAWGGRDGRFTYPDDMRPNPYGKGPQINRWKVDRDGTLVATVGHVHPGGLFTDLKVTRKGRTVNVFRSHAKYFDPNGPVSWDMAMKYTPYNWRVYVKKGDVLSVNTTYDTTRLSAYEAMGLMVPYIAYGDRSGVDPFKNLKRIPRKGKITHGHQAAAGNYGGEPTGRPDPRRLPDGGASSQAAVANWTYVPGDLSQANELGRPPVVRRGNTLTFTNYDEPAQVFHTITACKPPCNGSTGVSYPLPDGKYDFDSGQLGYGPRDYSPATNKITWSTPKGLPSGTYTYFCRVHPFMRGAFRVRK